MLYHTISADTSNEDASIIKTLASRCDMSIIFFAVLCVLGLSARNLLHLTNDSLAPLSPPSFPLAFSISSTFLPSLLSLSFWARCPSTRLPRSFSLLHLGRLLSWKSLIKFHGSGRFLNACIPLLTSHCISHVAPSLFTRSSLRSLIGIWHVYPSCLGKSGTFSSEKKFNFWWIFTFPLFAAVLSADLLPWKPLAPDSISLPELVQHETHQTQFCLNCWSTGFFLKFLLKMMLVMLWWDYMDMCYWLFYTLDMG